MAKKHDVDGIIGSSRIIGEKEHGQTMKELLLADGMREAYMREWRRFYGGPTATQSKAKVPPKPPVRRIPDPARQNFAAEGDPLPVCPLMLGSFGLYRAEHGSSSPSCDIDSFRCIGSGCPKWQSINADVDDDVRAVLDAIAPTTLGTCPECPGKRWADPTAKEQAEVRYDKRYTEAFAEATRQITEAGLDDGKDVAQREKAREITRKVFADRQVPFMEEP